MITVGSQYYRPPFPEKKYWAGDLRDMKKAGLNTVQLWVVWGWVESKPGSYNFEDYDKIISLAEEEGLQVVLSTIAAIHPEWIHHEIPGSEMVTSFGQKVVSVRRRECHFGLTPGGCIDNPEVWRVMERFLKTAVSRYKDTSNLAGWDIWNELRWNVQADGLVCYCAHTMKRFRTWLDEKYSGLDGLNKAWRMRYTDWNQVRPGKEQESPYTATMAFQHFLTERSNRHAADRYRAVKGTDPNHPATVHGGAPSMYVTGRSREQFALDRGNDWAFAETVDGIGTSSFPVNSGMDDTEMAVRFGASRSARRGKRFWLSELQGGRSSFGFNVHPPARGARQQRWVWNGLANGADTVLFWCWRDEVFGWESNGFGFNGGDGFYPERKRFMQWTRKVLDENAEVIENYVPANPEAGVFFSPQSYYLNWIEPRGGVPPLDDIRGYCRALVRTGWDFRLIEEEHLDELDSLNILYMPRVAVFDESAAVRITDWVKGGGTLVMEAETGSFDSAGIFRYPEDRPFVTGTGDVVAGRRELPGNSAHVSLRSRGYELPAAGYITPFSSGGSLLAESKLGSGTVLSLGTFCGRAYHEGITAGNADYASCTRDFEGFVSALCADSGLQQDVRITDPAPPRREDLVLKTGHSSGKPVIFVIGEHSAPLTLQVKGSPKASDFRDIITGTHLEAKNGRLRIEPNAMGVHLITV